MKRTFITAKILIARWRADRWRRKLVRGVIHRGYNHKEVQHCLNNIRAINHEIVAMHQARGDI